MSKGEFDEDLVAEFLTESREHLDNIEEDFLALEKQGDSPPADLVGKVFRAIHNLKGSSGCVGFRNISMVAHAMENLLSLVRQGKIRPNRENTDALFEGLDLIKTMLDNVYASEEVNGTAVIRRLNDLVEKGKPAGASPAGATSPGAQPGQSVSGSPTPPVATAPPPRSVQDPEPDEHDLAAQIMLDTQKFVETVQQLRRALEACRNRLNSGPQLTRPERAALFQEAVGPLQALPDLARFFGLDDVIPLGSALEKAWQQWSTADPGQGPEVPPLLQEAIDLIFTLFDTAGQEIKTDCSGVLTRLQKLISPAPAPTAPPPGPAVPSREQFITEARYLLRPLESQLVSAISATALPSPQLCQPIRQALETIQEKARAVGCENLAKLSQAMSRAVAGLAAHAAAEGREEHPGETPLDARKALDHLVQGYDLLNTILDDLEFETRYDIAEIVDDLGKFALSPHHGPPPASTPAAAPTPPPASSPRAPVPVQAAPPPDPARATRAARPTEPAPASADGSAGAGGGRNPRPGEAPATPGEAGPPSRSPETPSGESPAGEGRRPSRPGGQVAEVSRSELGDTVRISVEIIDKLMVLAGELVLVRNQQLFSVDKADPAARAIVQRLDVVTSELQETIMFTRMQPVGKVFGKFPRLVRDLSKKLGKQITLNIIGSEVELDKTILESLADPLTHLIRNSCDHGLEDAQDRLKAGKPAMGTITLRAFHEGGQINILVADDGRGMNPEVIRAKALEKGLKSLRELNQMTEKELLSLIMLPGFSTAAAVSEVSGRGVGMDVVKANLEKLGGTLDFDSTVGKGASFHLRLPLTLAIIPCLIIQSGGQRYAIPQFNVEELVCLFDRDIWLRLEYANGNEIFRLRERLLPLIRLSEVLAHPKPFSESTRNEVTEKYRLLKEHQLRTDPQALEESQGQSQGKSVVFAVLKVGTYRFGLLVDKIFGTEEIVVRPLHPALKSCACYSGATIMGDGKVALILDVEGVARHVGFPMAIKAVDRQVEIRGKKVLTELQSVLLFKVGPEETFAVPIHLLKRIEKIHAGRIERVGDREFVTIDEVSTFILRLDSLLKLSSPPIRDEMYLFLPKFVARPFGILLTDILDIVETIVPLNSETTMGPGILGSAVLNGHLTLFLDIYRLVELADPDWFDERRRRTPPPRDRKLVLVVDDTSFIRQMIKSYLEADGYEVVTAEDGQKGLERMRERNFDLIVSDINMPVMDGWEFMKNVRQWDRFKATPSVALTSLNTDADRARARECGYDRFEVKMDREAFLSCIADLLGKKPATAAGGQP